MLFSEYCMYGRDASQVLSTAHEVFGLSGLTEDQVREVSVLLLGSGKAHVRSDLHAQLTSDPATLILSLLRL